MLTSFFSKSRPINLTVVVVLLVIFYASANFFEWGQGENVWDLFQEVAVLGLLILSLFVLNFIAKKNDLTKRSAYKTLLFALFAISFAELLENAPVIISNLCILLALRRIISLKSHKFVQQKIFDATFWIAIATLYNFW